MTEWISRNEAEWTTDCSFLCDRNERVGILCCLIVLTKKEEVRDGSHFTDVTVKVGR